MRRDFLPGVSHPRVSPAVVCDARSAIAKARHLARARDVAQIVVLLAVDFLVIAYPSTHVPLLDRLATVTLMRVLNVGVFAQMWLSRVIPQWRARHIASTWSASERKRFLDQTRKRSPLS